MTTISDSVGSATVQAKEAAAHARATFFDLSAQILRLINGARAAEGRGVDSLLDRFGLQRRQSGVSPVLWFAAGAAVAGTALVLMSPRWGTSLRRRVATFFVEPTETRASKVEPRSTDGAGHAPSSGNNGIQHETD